MILVSVGTQKQQFNRIFNLIENSKKLKNMEIIAQSGYTNYKSETIKMLSFVSDSEFDDLINRCDLLICHGGVGTIFKALNQGKKVLVVPRLQKYGEHVNDHQLEICKALQNENFLLYLQDGEDIDDKIEELSHTTFKKYVLDEGYLTILAKQI
ncbi:MAG: glycosyltransferase [Clostridia bacterium]|nr:glycosyltransferase [Clostridia bacterium]